jgi:hypothetical protein
VKEDARGLTTKAGIPLLMAYPGISLFRMVFMDSWERLQKVAVLLNRYGIISRRLQEGRLNGNLSKKNEKKLNRLLRKIESKIVQLAAEQEMVLSHYPQAEISTVVVLLPRRLL